MTEKNEIYTGGIVTTIEPKAVDPKPTLDQFIGESALQTRAAEQDAVRNYLPNKD